MWLAPVHTAGRRQELNSNLISGSKPMNLLSKKQCMICDQPRGIGMTVYSEKAETGVSQSDLGKIQ